MIKHGIYYEGTHCEGTKYWFVCFLKQARIFTFKIIHFRCSKVSHHTYSSNCTIISYNRIQTCGNPATVFGLLWPSAGRHATSKSAIMDSSIIYVKSWIWNTNINMVKKIKQHSTVCIIIDTDCEQTSNTEIHLRFHRYLHFNFYWCISVT
jgi:hypothetical protein